MRNKIQTTDLRMNFWKQADYDLETLFLYWTLII